MATTALVVEILVAGLLATVWIIGIPVLLLFPTESERMVRGLLGGTSFSILLGLGVLAIAYPLGWLVNAVTSGVALVTYRRSLQRRIFGIGCTSALYRDLRVLLMMCDQCAELARNLDSDTAVQRIARSAGLNFLAIGGLLLVVSESYQGRSFGLIFLLASAIFWWIAIYYHATTYLKIKAAAARLPEGREILSYVAKLPELATATPLETSLHVSDVGGAAVRLATVSPNQAAAPDGSAAGERQ